MRKLLVSLIKWILYLMMTIGVQSSVLEIFEFGSDISKQTIPKKLEVNIYYSALCPHSKKFIHHFRDAMIEKKLFNYTDFKLIPYGKAKIWKDPLTSEEHVICQHGYRECELNAVHACIIENNNKMEQIHMIDCLMGGLTLRNCMDNLGIHSIGVLKCISSRSVIDILRKYGEETDAIGLMVVPSISLDGLLDPAEQKRLSRDFANMFCERYKQKYNIELDNCNW